MPKVYLTEYQRIWYRLSAWVYGQMKFKKITQKTIAEKRGVTQEAISRKLCLHRFSFEDVICFVEVFEPEDDEIIRLVRGK